MPNSIVKETFLSAIASATKEEFSEESPLMTDNSSASKNVRSTRIICQDGDKNKTVEAYHTIGPSTILDLPTEYPTYYVALPYWFKRVFHFLTVNSGCIRLTPLTIQSCGEMQTGSNGTISEGKSDMQTLKNDAAINTDVEISLLGVIFLTTISGMFMHNILISYMHSR
jgi:hypothetical protein